MSHRQEAPDDALDAPNIGIIAGHIGASSFAPRSLWRMLNTMFSDPWAVFVFTLASVSVFAFVFALNWVSPSSAPLPAVVAAFESQLRQQEHAPKAQPDRNLTLEEVLEAAAYKNKTNHNNNNHNHNNNITNTEGNSDNGHYNESRRTMANKSKGTVIITTINAAWTQKHEMGCHKQSMMDLFLESMREGIGTASLMRHLIVGCMDQVAYDHCRSSIHTSSDFYDNNIDSRFQCFQITTPGINFSGEQLFQTSDYIKMIWRRIDFLISVLRLGYDFVFTDADILWLRDPLPLLFSDQEADFQIACDIYNGNPFDLLNLPNAGFTYARATNKTIRFYEFWYEQRKRDERMADQEVLNAIKFDPGFSSIGLKLRLHDTQFLGGFCSFGSTDLSKALTMHATCCKGLEAKLEDLHTVMDDWKRWKRCNSSSDSVPADDDQEDAEYRSPSPSPSPSILAPAAAAPVLFCSKRSKDPSLKPLWACPRSWVY